MRIFEQGIDRDEDILEVLTSGSPVDEPEVEETVRGILDQVRKRGDEALLEFGRRFDSPHLKALQVPPPDIDKALDSLDLRLVESLEAAASNIREFHEKEKLQSWVTTENGKILGQLVRPIGRIGIYVPGGRASYPSTVLMTAIPAVVAGVGELSISTPAAPDGDVPQIVLAACCIAGVSRVFRIGGAQAIAAFAYGTETVPRVDKVVGPGNQYVNSAKRQLYGSIGIDSLAGPSEVLIIADGTAPVDWLAADLLAQAEHGGESKAILITWSRDVADRVLGEVRRQTDSAERADYIRQALANRGAIVVVKDKDEALRWANACAPEHLQLCVGDPQEWLGGISNAGAAFVGPFTPVPIGDYSAGPSHTLPTGTCARFSSALGVSEFQKRTSLLWYSRDGYRQDADVATTIADSEGLTAHKRSLQIRLEEH